MSESPSLSSDVSMFFVGGCSCYMESGSGYYGDAVVKVLVFMGVCVRNQGASGDMTKPITEGISSLYITGLIHLRICNGPK